MHTRAHAHTRTRTRTHAKDAYGKPNSSSSNTGFEQADAVIVYFVVDDAGVMSLVLTFDSVHDGSGGEVYMSIDAP